MSVASFFLLKLNRAKMTCEGATYRIGRLKARRIIAMRVHVCMCVC